MYEFFSIASGIALLGLAAFDSSAKINQRLWFLVGGVGFIAYGIYVSNQTSGTYVFPIWIFVIPFAVGGYAVYGVVTRMGSRTGSTPRAFTPNASTAADRPGSASLYSEQAPNEQGFCGECGAAWDRGAQFCHACGGRSGSDDPLISGD